MFLMSVMIASLLSTLWRTWPDILLITLCTGICIYICFLLLNGYLYSLVILSSDEACLKCRGSITVFYQMNKSVRLHKCSKSSLRHLHPELYIQSQFLASKLGLADTSDSTGAVISCDLQGCPAEFDASSEGIFQFLKHVNKLKHSSLSNCKKCSLPDFQLTFRETKIISHYCPKNGKLVYVIKSTLN